MGGVLVNFPFSLIKTNVQELYIWQNFDKPVWENQY